MSLRINVLVLFIFLGTCAYGQEAPDAVKMHERSQVEGRHSLGASVFMLGNFLKDSPEYVLLTYGYKLAPRDRIFAEFNTWRYAEPLGTYTKSDQIYPGFVRATGLGLGYQRFHWEGLFSVIQATFFSKQYHDTGGMKTQKGFQLYLQVIAGYRIEFFKKRFYIEPGYALKYWPVDTNFPADFAVVEKGAPKYIFEPSFNFGVRF